jgi:hypothetical protein
VTAFFAPRRTLLPTVVTGAKRWHRPRCPFATVATDTPPLPEKKQPKKPEVVRAENKQTGVKVKEGTVHKVHPQQVRNEEAHQLKLKEMSIPKRHRRPYEKIKFGKKRQAKEVRKMNEKRKKLSDNGDELKDEITLN